MHPKVAVLPLNGPLKDFCWPWFYICPVFESWPIWSRKLWGPGTFWNFCTGNFTNNKSLLILMTWAHFKRKLNSILISAFLGHNPLDILLVWKIGKFWCYPTKLGFMQGYITYRLPWQSICESNQNWKNWFGMDWKSPLCCLVRVRLPPMHHYRGSYVCVVV